MNNEELTTQVSALDIKQGTVVVLRLGSDTPVSVARTMGEELQKLVPFGNLILVLPNGESIEALDEAQMRELGWVRASGAAQDVLAERQRQVTAEGWSPKHDDQYKNTELAFAASCYAFHAAAASWDLEDDGIPYDSHPVPKQWPWDPSWWKPTDVRRDLVKAGALILAEIERIDRAADKAGADRG
ncbi:hypothetical protein [Pseudomonas sp.]|uniref:hypothetical protein n=1 Tax=Pseudomonas sp. TaxID=306 RepID=UPI00258E2C4E|nr:hypothetical protein [Pseudomonas sp.]